MPREKERAPASHQVVRMAVYGSGCCILFGVLTKLFNSETQRERLGNSPGDDKTAINEDAGAQSDSTATLSMTVGLVVLILAVVTAQVNGQVERFLISLCEKPVSRGLGYLATLG